MEPVAHTSIKVHIPHPDEPGIALVGVLEQLAPGQPTHGRKIALILHGTMGHKDYLFLRRLAIRLPLDSFRFDFRGNHESGGTWNQGALEDDVADVAAAAVYLETRYGYTVDTLVGHSRGSVVAMRWLCTAPEAVRVSAFVNVSGRYRMKKIMDTVEGRKWTESFARQGYYLWNVTVARKAVTGRITQEDVNAFVRFDTTLVWNRFPAATDVLTLHGLEDTTVPPCDAIIYARAFARRTPGTQTLHLMEGADHNFTGRQDEVVNVIVRWWEGRKREGKL